MHNGCTTAAEWRCFAYNTEKTTEFFDDRATFLRQFEWRDTVNPRHRVTNALTWEIPVRKGRWLLKDAARPVDLAVGGWQFTTSTRFYSGRILQFGQSLLVNPATTQGLTCRRFNADLNFCQVPTPPLTSPEIPRTNPWTFPGLVGPKTWQTDMGISKSFSMTERFKLEARVEAYNAFNHLNWDKSRS